MLFCSKTLRVWDLDLENRKIRPQEVSMGQLKRTVKCIQVSSQHFIFNSQTHQ